RGELSVSRVSSLVSAVPTTVASVLDRVGSVGVIVPDALVPAVAAALDGVPFALVGSSPDPESAQVEFDSRLDLVPSSLAKGLEFDHVVLLEPAGIVAGEPDEMTGLRRLYVCLTRAVTSLTVLHADPLPAALADSSSS
ncbi:MAG TPA: ATP-binding domain-containing protein, partial [Marmoricola sp.]|nr:ATP-binding domain-containing protein [Marmoricola sp.]